MSREFVRQPVIIMGMHRSGTTMVTELLDRVGLFVGHELENNHESVYFLHLNNVILAQARAAWDHPTPFGDFLNNRDAVEMTIRCLRSDLQSYRIHRYLGLRRYLKYRSLDRFDKPWGWKDPRNVFTLPLWLKLFPGARIVYIVRNGVDVARSLLVREQEYLAWQKERLEKKLGQVGERTNLERVGFRGSIRCLSLEGCFTLWEQYMAQAEETLAAMSNDRLVIKYEDFLAAPVVHLARMVKFCGLAGAFSQVIREVAGRVNGQRAYAFLSDPELEKFYHKVRTSRWMKQYSYAGPLRPSQVEPNTPEESIISSLPPPLVVSSLPCRLP